MLEIISNIIKRQDGLTKQLAKANEVPKPANRLEAGLIYLIAHELRTPRQPIHGLSIL
jgi:hypothetical protein